MRCQQYIYRGPNKGDSCSRRATMVILYNGSLTCGIHARGYTKPGLVRLAYWNKEARAWL